MDRNSRTPRLVAHYRPAPPGVWLRTLVILGLLALGAIVYRIIT